MKINNGKNVDKSPIFVYNIIKLRFIYGKVVFKFGGAI